MSPENEQFLKDNLQIWEFYKLTQGEIRSFNRDRLLQLIREEWEPRYLCCLQCGADVAKLLEYAYTQYEKHPNSQHMTFPKQKKQRVK